MPAVEFAEPEPSAREQAELAARSGRPEQAAAWALIAIADDVAKIRQDLHWQRQQVRRG